MNSFKLSKKLNYSILLFTLFALFYEQADSNNFVTLSTKDEGICTESVLQENITPTYEDIINCIQIKVCFHVQQVIFPNFKYAFYSQQINYKSYIYVKPISKILLINIKSHIWHRSSGEKNPSFFEPVFG
jgi:hypothetical protein